MFATFFNLLFGMVFVAVGMGVCSVPFIYLASINHSVIGFVCFIVLALLFVSASITYLPDNFFNIFDN